ncbi:MULTISPECIES: YsnF/AvaK domain-containing protein [unclassified Curtobacterium]|uniref:YsnF/AvaK domain-containing protein n=1 Tax=unclassified Curtobacterium TaxID=257496 RepID=UPI00226B2B95|nr:MULTISPECIES: YsnF/AvaK domain-containing protein [unclassified Curtobacterium]
MTDMPVPQPAPGDDDREATVVLHEEHLLVGTEVHATERVRLERYVVTEQRTITVDVRREEVRLVREPLAEGPALPADRTPPTREPVVVVLHEEQVVVSKRIVPVERVTLTVHTVTEDRPVDAVLRHEEVTVDEDRTQDPDMRR